MFNKSKFKLALYLALMFVVVAIGIWAVATANLNEPVKTAEINTEQTKPSARTRTYISYIADSGMTSLQQLFKEADDVITEESEFGEYVASIEGHKGGTDGKYWSFYIDGKLSNVGADTYIQKGQEKIEWKFQKL